MSKSSTGNRGKHELSFLLMCFRNEKHLKLICNNCSLAEICKLFVLPWMLIQGLSCHRVNWVNSHNVRHDYNTENIFFSNVYFHVSHMIVHHLLHCLHYHHLYLLLLIQSFILNLRLRFSANHFLHGPFPFLLDWFYGLLDYLMFYSAQRLDLFAWCVRLSQL